MQSIELKKKKKKDSFYYYFLYYACVLLVALEKPNPNYEAAADSFVDIEHPGINLSEIYFS